jgi:hypothetical protein
LFSLIFLIEILSKHFESPLEAMNLAWVDFAKESVFFHFHAVKKLHGFRRM